MEVAWGLKALGGSSPSPSANVSKKGKKMSNEICCDKCGKSLQMDIHQSNFLQIPVGKRYWVGFFCSDCCSIVKRMTKDFQHRERAVLYLEAANI